MSRSTQTSGPTIFLTRAQARQADRRAIEDYGIPGIVLMENAGRSAAGIIREIASSRPPGESNNRTAHIFCGPGNNGGDGYVIARHLANHGFDVHILLATPRDRVSGDAAIHLHIAEKLGLSIADFTEAAHDKKTSIIVDALLGTGAVGDPRCPIKDAIHAINANKQTAPDTLVFAIDIPSGLDADTGIPGNPTVAADHTITFMAPKAGFASEAANRFLGIVHVADIGIPISLLQKVVAP